MFDFKYPTPSGTHMFPRKLQFQTTKILNLTECQEIFSKENSLDPTYKNLCTINPVGKGACMGDSGITI